MIGSWVQIPSTSCIVTKEVSLAKALPLPCKAASFRYQVLFGQGNSRSRGKNPLPGTQGSCARMHLCNACVSGVCPSHKAGTFMGLLIRLICEVVEEDCCSEE